jgi:hypothetical protein
MSKIFQISLRSPPICASFLKSRADRLHGVSGIIQGARDEAKKALAEVLDQNVTDDWNPDTKIANIFRADGEHIASANTSRNP